MNDDTVTVALVGIAGYGSHFVTTILDEADGKNIKCVAAVARRPERCGRLDELKAAGAEVYPNLNAFYENGTADLVIISSPIHLHCEQTCLALANGSNVLCEKPVSATVQEALQMAEKEEESDRFVAIGYQWSFSDAIQSLKRDILAGEFGRPVRLKTMVSWPRSKSYYNRNDWAGGLKTSDGSWILDSPANNATAHYLFNMLYVLGDTRETSACPAEVQAELYRANAIENFDTGAIRCRTTAGTEILFYTSHAMPSAIGPVGCYEFEKGVVYYDIGAGNTIVARFADGSTRTYGNPNTDHTHKTWQSVEAVRTGAPPACGIRCAMAQTICLNGAQDSMPEITSFPEEMIKVEERGEDEQTLVAGLQAAFVQCYDQGILPSEHGELAWSRSGKTIDLHDYRAFRPD